MGNGGMSHLTKLDSLTNKMDRLIERTRHASAGFSSFADTNQVDTHRLDQIYEHDMSVLEKVESLDESISAMENAADANDNVGKAIRDVSKKLDEIDGALDSREKILKGLA
jgi:hypothetical protein